MKKEKRRKQIREASKRHYKKNRKKRMNAVLDWRRKHPDKVREYNKNHTKAIGKHTLKEWEQLKKKFNYCCAACGRQEPFTDLWYEKLTEDHIIPVSKGGTNYIDNIQPLCIICNCKKGNH
jgi:5-methylcytosine-specific restriction endonuclease McrA